MSFDAHKNFAYSTVATAPSPATSGTSLVVQAGDGAKFPAAPFNATVWPAGVQPTSDVAEIVRVTAKSTDTLTITRAQESSTARSVLVGDQIAATITAKTLTDIENATGLLNTVASSGASQTIDYATANTWDVTLTAACTFTLASVTSGVPTTLTLILRQDATGGRLVTWPGSVTWLNGVAPTLHPAANAVDIVTVFTDDGGTTWTGFYQSSSGVEIGYDQTTSSVNITGTSSASPTTVIAGSAYTFDGRPVIVEAYAATVQPPSTNGGTLIFALYEGSTQITFAEVKSDTTSGFYTPCELRYRFTPSAGSHTYSLKAWVSGTTNTPFVGQGGSSAPTFIRITKA